jgi:hypothetical protein
MLEIFYGGLLGLAGIFGRLSDQDMWQRKNEKTSVVNNSKSSQRI